MTNMLDALKYFKKDSVKSIVCVANSLTEEEYNTVIEQLQLALLLENGCGWCI